MPSPRLSPLLAALALALVLGAAPGRAAPDDSLRVPTRFVTRVEQASVAQHPPGEVLAEWNASGAVTLTATPPPLTGWVPPEPPFLYGTFDVAGRDLLVALGIQDDRTAVIGLDLDGDKSLRTPGEVLPPQTGRVGRLHGRAVMRWALPTRKLSPTLELDVTFRQLLQTHEAVVVTAAGPKALALSETQPAGVTAPPAAGTVFYATYAAPGGSIPLAFVRGEVDRLTLMTDANRDGTIGEASEIYPVPVGGRDPGVTMWRVQGVSLGGETVDVAYREVDPEGQVAWNARSTGALRGTIQRGNTTYELHLLDADFDGTYTSAGDWWWFGPMSALAKYSRLLPDSMMPVSQPFYLDAPWRLVSVDADGNAVLVKDPNAPDPDAYLRERTEKVNEERYFPLFAKDTHFAQERGIDTSRPKTTAPARWYHDVGLRATLARAKASGKPVLVDFEADWCNNCKRWDYHVYSDREVAGLLGQFELLKVNVDFNFSNDLQRLGGSGPPYLVFLAPDGQPLLQFPQVDAQQKPTGKQIGGLMYFQPPRDFVQTLRAALAAWRRKSGR